AASLTLSRFPYTTLFRSLRRATPGQLSSPSRPAVRHPTLSSQAAAYRLVRIRSLTRNEPKANHWSTSIRPEISGNLALGASPLRSEEHTSELQSRVDLVC